MYERTFGTDWETIDDRDRIVRRAFALGVAKELGEEFPGELERLSDEIDTAYDRSFVEIAYQKGREKAGNLKPTADGETHVWEELVEEKTTIDPDAQPDGVDLDETMDLPDPLEGIDIARYQVDSRDRVRRPSFLERDGGGDRGSDPGNRGKDGDRSPFGHSPSDDRRRRFDDGNGTGNGTGTGAEAEDGNAGGDGDADDANPGPDDEIGDAGPWEPDSSHGDEEADNPDRPDR
ncbi:hypothetical protein CHINAEXTREME_14630 [Halobiforma lacisalsi AJ5]|uniref:Uncharacterized protein n=1 Tax=Natronobacterium lacisalsi AJ5 TaxID=358396 RepID=M0L134_NATLA|nr:hypothetical protein [Halobiforma lacisalsi]APW98934.1 hypothetical protein CHINAEXTREME_14630 [Halobiforma lacisalsi AJ5]EMA27272.1 hypothetical protein C445_20800 [Halobiforma lacisalsi AJ5]